MNNLFARKKAIALIEKAFLKLIKLISNGKASKLEINTAKAAYFAALKDFAELLHSQPDRDARYYSQNATVMMLHSMSNELIKNHNSELIEMMRTNVLNLAEELPEEQRSFGDKIHEASIRNDLKKPTI